MGGQGRRGVGGARKGAEWAAEQHEAVGKDGERNERRAGVREGVNASSPGACPTPAPAWPPPTGPRASTSTSTSAWCGRRPRPQRTVEAVELSEKGARMGRSTIGGCIVRAGPPAPAAAAAGRRHGHGHPSGFCGSLEGQSLSRDGIESGEAEGILAPQRRDAS